MLKKIGNRPLQVKNLIDFEEAEEEAVKSMGGINNQINDDLIEFGEN